MKATFVRQLGGKDWRGDARLYRMDPPIEYEYWTDDPSSSENSEAGYVVVSAIVSEISGPETYIFPTDGNGKVLDWCELPGSFRGRLDHAAALQGAGYDTEVTA
jgi:hypothetical protein